MNTYREDKKTKPKITRLLLQPLFLYYIHGMRTFVLFILYIVASGQLSHAQTKSKVSYDACILKDSIDKNLIFIQQNVSRIFTDTAECKQVLFDSVCARYLATQHKKYLDAFVNLRTVGADKVKDYYTDVIKQISEANFSGFIHELYLGRGRYMTLEKELVSTMNMIVDGRLLKTRYLGLINVEISKANDVKDQAKVAFLLKLKSRIELDKY